MILPSQRTALLLNINPRIAKPSTVGHPSTSHYLHRANCRRWAPSEHPIIAPVRTLHRSESQISIQNRPSGSKLSKSLTEVIPEKLPVNAQISIIQAIRAVHWSNVYSVLRHQLTPDNVLHFVRNIPTHAVATYNMVLNSREYELARMIVVKSWQWSVHLAKTAFIWTGLFLESREYFYLRYYTLLALEHTIMWLRYGIRASFNLLRAWTASK
uniref:Uncharacterized protein n=1 Tax=Anopheles farauti TaxID=69004 RepID=A0A182QQB3_9DIPT